jgi:hypothetical protein
MNNKQVQQMAVGGLRNQAYAPIEELVAGIPMLLCLQVDEKVQY